MDKPQEVIDWFIVNKCVQIFKQFAAKRNKDASLVEFINEKIELCEKYKKELKGSACIKKMHSQEIPYNLKCIFDDCESFLKGKDDIKALSLITIMSKDICSLKELLSKLKTMEDVEDVKFSHEIFSNIDLSDDVVYKWMLGDTTN